MSGFCTRPGARCAGFTLVELLTALGIIAVLVAVAYPVGSHITRTSRATACMQNLRQIGGALSQYLGDFDGTFPTMVMARENKEQEVPALDTVLGPYVKEPRIFACPDDSKQLAAKTGTSYLWNYKLNGQKLASLSVSYMRLSPIDDPSRIMVIGDKEGFHPTLSSKLNVLYADGHASQELTFVEETEE